MNNNINNIIDENDENNQNDKFNNNEKKKNTLGYSYRKKCFKNIDNKYLNEIQIIFEENIK